MKNKSLKRKAHRTQAAVSESCGDAGSKLAKLTDKDSTTRQDPSPEETATVAVNDVPDKTSPALDTHSEPDVQQDKIPEQPKTEVVSHIVPSTDRAADISDLHNQTEAEYNQSGPADESRATAEHCDANQQEKHSSIAEVSSKLSEEQQVDKNKEKQEDVTVEQAGENTPITVPEDKGVDIPVSNSEQDLAVETVVAVENEVDNSKVRSEKTKVCFNKVNTEEAKVHESKVTPEKADLHHNKVNSEGAKVHESEINSEEADIHPNKVNSGKTESEDCKVNSETVAVVTRGSKGTEHGQHDEGSPAPGEKVVDHNNHVASPLNNSNNNAADLDSPSRSSKAVQSPSAGDDTMATDDVTTTDDITPADDDITADDDVTDDITDSQLCEVDWPSQFLSQAQVSLEAQTEPGQATTSTEIPTTATEATQVSTTPATEDPQMENATAVVVTLIKELQHINRSMLKTKREIETARRQRHH